MSELKASRRRFIRISGIAGLGLAAGGLVKADGGEKLRRWDWEGVLFGADVTIRLYGTDARRLACLTQECFRKMRELERQFSLFLPDSAICRLNRDGRVDRPPPEFVDLLSRAREYSVATDGAFDVTVQPIWRCLRDYAEKGGGDHDSDIFRLKLREALAKTGFEKIVIHPSVVRFTESGMAITLNGIAQGYITDRVAEFLKTEGVQSTLINLGEYRVIGSHPSGRAWRLGVCGGGGRDRLIDTIELRTGALAVSGGHGMTFGRTGWHHLIHPATGLCQRPERTVAVTARTATQADALSTAFGVVDDRGARTLAERFGVGLGLYGGESKELQNQGGS